MVWLWAWQGTPTWRAAWVSNTSNSASARWNTAAGVGTENGKNSRRLSPCRRSSATTGRRGSGLAARAGASGSFAAGAGGSASSAATLGMAAAGGAVVGATPSTLDSGSLGSGALDSDDLDSDGLDSDGLGSDDLGSDGLGSMARIVSGAITPAGGPVATTAAGALASIGLTSTT